MVFSERGLSEPEKKMKKDFTGSFLFFVKSLTESPAFISHSILIIEPSFSLGDKAQSNK